LSSNWPVLTSYDRDHLLRIALPLGGIGTGTVSLGGRGQLRDWELMSRPAKGFVPMDGIGKYGPFFALWTKDGNGHVAARALEGKIPAEEYEGSSGAVSPNHGLARFRECEFLAAYPLGQVLLRDPAVPLHVRLEAFNPLIPGDDEASSLPVAVLRYQLTNPTSSPVEATVCGTVPNYIGFNGRAGTKPGLKLDNRNRFEAGEGVRGVVMTSANLPQDDEAWGSMALSTTAADGVSHRTSWANLSWGNTLLDFWDDLLEDGRLDERTVSGPQSMPRASLAVSLSVPPGETKSVTFLLTWHFPNRVSWTPTQVPEGCDDGSCHDKTGANPNLLVNHYTTRFADAWDAARRIGLRLAELEAGTVNFVRAFCDSDLPAVVKEGALYNLSTLRTQTCFRTADGYFYGWEGCDDSQGWCHGSCTHVWNYEHATGFLFGNLARLMREVEYLHMTLPTGRMCFRVNLPLGRSQDHIAAADGQMGSLMRLYREWQLSGDDAFLRRMWPKAKLALEYCWIPLGWDADQDGVMEGCQHNTMDVEYYGPNPQMTGWYLGALRAVEEMARYLGEEEFADRCESLFLSGSAWMDAHLFNGEYYEQEIRPAMSAENIAPGLRHQSMGSADLVNPILQLGSGCLVDQLVGQYTAHICGLDYLHAPEKVRATLSAILRYNHLADFSSHTNHMRTYVLNDEAALLMASYPRGRRPKEPFPYFSEVMTGFEYTAAIGMLYEGMTEEGLKCIADIRHRYDGKKRSPFNEAECGYHYARAMASWAAVLALTGFAYSGVTRSLSFAASETPVKWFWSNGEAWGTFSQAPGGQVSLTVLHGSLNLRELNVGALRVEFGEGITLGKGHTGHWELT